MQSQLGWFNSWHCTISSFCADLQAQAEVDEVLAGREQPGLGGYQRLRYLLRCVNESMRLYPHPPVLLRRAQLADELPGKLTSFTQSCVAAAKSQQTCRSAIPVAWRLRVSSCCAAGGFKVPAKQDVIVSVYNIHHSAAVWDEPERFLPERFSLDEPPPTEANTDYRHGPASTVSFLQCSQAFARCLMPVVCCLQVHPLQRRAAQVRRRSIRPDGGCRYAGGHLEAL